MIDYYRLKKHTSFSSFAIFSNEDRVLTITGLGKCAMAAGVAYSQGLFPQQSNPAMLNVGIAGHQGHPIGALFLADKITDSDTGRSYYPPLVFSQPCPAAHVITFSKPQENYPELALCDMEASAFYETACRFSTGELVQCLKVVSDNDVTPVTQVQPKTVEALIQAQLPVIDEILRQLTTLAGQITEDVTPEFDRLSKRFRFSIHETQQLKKLLARWRLLQPGVEVESVIAVAANGKDVLRLLTLTLNKTEFSL